MPEVLTDPVERVQDEIKAKRYPDMTAKFEQMKQREELHRLEREVIEAAKVWNSTNHRDVLKCEERLTNLGDAVDSLIEFESKQQQVKQG